MFGIYEVKTKHDSGYHKTKLSAGSFDNAALQVMALEKCPRRSIKSVKFIREV